MIRTLSLPSWFGFAEPKAQMAKMKATGPVVSVKTLRSTQAQSKAQAATGSVVRAQVVSKPASKRWRINLVMPWQWVNGAVAACVVLVVASYMIGINTYATKGYALKAVQKRVTALQNEQKKLAIDQAASASMRLVADVASAHQLVPVTNVEQLLPKQFSKR
jgi:hypothetical protein